MLDITFGDAFSGNFMMSGIAARADYIPLILYMNLGNLRPGALSEERFSEINSWFQNPWLTDTLYTVEFMQSAVPKLDLILNRAYKGEPIRIWYDHTPESICNYFCLVSFITKLKGCEPTILSVCLNEHEFFSKQYAAIGQLSPLQIGELREAERCLSLEECVQVTEKWDVLCQEPYPLRIYENGEIKGVPIDYYDTMIRECIPEKRFTVFDIITKALRPGFPDYYFLLWRSACVLQDLDVNLYRKDPTFEDPITWLRFDPPGRNPKTTYMVLRIDTDFDALPSEEAFPVVDYPEGVGSGYAEGEFLISGRNAQDLFENFCKLYDLRAHAAYYRTYEYRHLDEEQTAELEMVESLVEKAQNGTLRKSDFWGLFIELWEGSIEVLWVLNDKSIINKYPGINILK